MKRIFLFFIIIFSSGVVKAQYGYNFMPSGIGFDASTIRGYTNVAKQNNTLAFSIHYSYYPSPYFPVIFELQRGRLWGGSRVTDEYRREYENNFFALLLHTDLQLGQVVDYDYNDILNLLKNVYWGAGGGLVIDNIQNQRYNLLDQGYPVGTYRFPGNDYGVCPEVDFRTGYEFKFFNSNDEPFLRLHIEYAQHYVFGNGLDGYTDPAGHFKNNAPDQYRQVTIGLIYNFGFIKAFTKPIRDQYP